MRWDGARIWHYANWYFQMLSACFTFALSVCHLRLIKQILLTDEKFKLHLLFCNVMCLAEEENMMVTNDEVCLSIPHREY
jgi:hypothetical protein